jgi:hypothetical protein
MGRMIKLAFKYYFILSLFLSYSYKIINANPFNSNPSINSTVIFLQCYAGNFSLQFSNFNLEKKNVSAFLSFRTKLFILKSIKKAHIRKYRNAIELKNKHCAKFLIKNNSDLLTPNFLHSKLIDKTNHCCFRN